ncbi:methyltransferase domain-containing protein [Cycloclasticus zancles]|nr:methyltransferase domain-containing protein [Cycloclasticus zancles]
MTDVSLVESHVLDLLVCPKCKLGLNEMEQAYQCTACDMTFPVLFGIPDFRLRSDKYLTLQQERDKAERLFEKSKELSFNELVEFYYQITDDVPIELSRRYTAYVLNAPFQAGPLIDSLEPNKSTVLLDVGCGSGGLLQAANGIYVATIGVDIALRWLVIAKKRLDEAGVQSTLICADVENLPFKDKSIDHVVANDVLEHVYNINAALKEMSRQLKNNGKLWVSGSNRFFIGPNATTRLWGIGLFPKGIRTWLLVKIRGIDSLRYIHLISPLRIRKMLLGHFSLLNAGPKKVILSSTKNYPFQDRILISIYQKLTTFGPLRHLLFLLGPAFEMTFIKNNIKTKDGI